MAEPVEEAPAEGQAGYGPEPRFPWVLAGAWIVFSVWGLYYVTEKLIPAYEAWKP